MLSSVLRSEQAVRVNIEIMRTFVRLRALLQQNTELAAKLEALEKKYDARFRVVFEAIRDLMKPPAKPAKRIGFAPERASPDATIDTMSSVGRLLATSRGCGLARRS